MFSNICSVTKHVKARAHNTFTVLLPQDLRRVVYVVSCEESEFAVKKQNPSTKPRIVRFCCLKNKSDDT